MKAYCWESRVVKTWIQQSVDDGSIGCVAKLPVQLAAVLVRLTLADVIL
jgi:hypothetical protein